MRSCSCIVDSHSDFALSLAPPLAETALFFRWSPCRLGTAGGGIWFVYCKHLFQVSTRSQRHITNTDTAHRHLATAHQASSNTPPRNTHGAPFLFFLYVAPCFAIHLLMSHHPLHFRNPARPSPAIYIYIISIYIYNKYIYIYVYMYTCMYVYHII
jgi:hypothetical protein